MKSSFVSLRRAVCAGALFFAAFAELARAQNYDLSWNTVDCGGGSFSTGGVFELSGTFGQPDAGPRLSGGGFEMAGGFWAAFVDPPPEDCNGNGVPDESEVAGPLSGYVLDFDGADDVVEVPGFGAIAPTTEITLEFWQKADANTQQVNLWMGPANQSNSLGVNCPWQDASPYGSVYWRFGNSATGGSLSYPLPVSVVGTWHHFAFVATYSGNAMRIYRNGVLEASKDGMDRRELDGETLRIGRFVNDGYNYAGLIDEVRIWIDARTQAQIQATMNTRLNGDEAGLRAYWRFDEGAGTTAADSAGNSDGTLNNGPTWVAVHIDYNSNGIPDECEECERGNLRLGCCPLPGDLNHDGERNGADIQLFTNCVLLPVPQVCACADIDSNGAIEAVGDVAGFVAILVGSTP